MDFSGAPIVLKGDGVGRDDYGIAAVGEAVYKRGVGQVWGSSYKGTANVMHDASRTRSGRCHGNHIALQINFLRALDEYLRASGRARTKRRKWRSFDRTLHFEMI